MNDNRIDVTKEIVAFVLASLAGPATIFFVDHKAAIAVTFAVFAAVNGLQRIASRQN